MRPTKDRYIACLAAILMGAMTIGCESTKGFLGHDPPDPFTYSQTSVADRPSESTTPLGTPVTNGAYARLPVQSTQVRPSEQLPATSQPATNEVSQQQYCPVTGNKLGSMGPPVAVEIAGRTVYVCCAGCVEKLKQDPQKYLDAGGASLSAGTASNATEDYRTSTEPSSCCGTSSGSGRSSCGCH
jgi:YHS domain-containing protein